MVTMMSGAGEEILQIPPPYCARRGSINGRRRKNMDIGELNNVRICPAGQLCMLRGEISRVYDI